jgi:prolyl oligopeptidase
MQNPFRLSLLFAVAALLFSCSSKKTLKPDYPVTRKTDTVDTYFGTKIADPYRWLEDDNSSETADWVKQQNQVTYNYLYKIPFRSKIKNRLKEIWNYSKVSVPWKRGKYYFYTKNDGIQNQSVLYVQEGLEGNSRLLLDPNKLDEDGTTSLGSLSVRKDGKYLAYAVSKAGSDWQKILVMDIETGKTLSDTINWIKFSGADWKDDGFYYSAYDAPSDKHTFSGKNANCKVFYHRLGSLQSQDELVYEDKEHPLRSYGMGVSDDGKIAALYSSATTSSNALKLKNLAPGSQWKDVDTSFKFDYSIIEYLPDNSVLIQTNNDAPNNRLIKVDVANPAKENWKVIIPESKDLLQSTAVCGGKIAATYLHDVTSKVLLFSLDGKPEGEVKLPAPGIVGWGGDKDDSIAFFSFTNFVTPACIYRYNINTGQSHIFFKPKVDFKGDDYETKQVFYNSKDGTRVPMFITYKKGTKLDGTAPCFLYGYGGFNISVTPGFQITNALFLEAGGIYAVANLRGGGEYGSNWHWSGTKCNKQNVFDDFIAAADYLVKERYTSHEKLAIHGRSNGGLLIGAIIAQRPDIAKVAIPTVGVMDMLRYHKFTIGYFWASDYGTSDSLQDFKCLLKYSPLHNLKQAEYPATLITTGDHDDRVVPAHSFKFAATLQQQQKGDNPTLIRIDVNAGHGGGKPTTKLIDEWTDIWSFVFYNLGVEY